MNQNASPVNVNDFIEFKPYWARNLKSFSQRAGYKIYIKKSIKGFIDAYLSPFQTLRLYERIWTLASKPVPLDAGIKKNTVDQLRIAQREFVPVAIDYRVLPGKVYIERIEAKPGAAKGEELPGLYLVRKTAAGEWSEPQEVNEISTKYAAVNGQSNPLSVAPDLMGKHVLHSFGKSLEEFTLFHNPSDGFLGDTYESFYDKFVTLAVKRPTAVTRQFAQVLVEAQRADKDVGWVAHSQGGIIFHTAVRHHRDTGKGVLDKHSVWFHGNANQNIRTNRTLKQAKVTILGYTNHPLDPVHQVIGLNTLNPIKIGGAIIAFPLLFSKDQQKSPHTLPYKGSVLGWIKNGWFK